MAFHNNLESGIRLKDACYLINDLEKAKEEQAYSDFAASRDYAKKAAILAEIAKKKAKVEMRIDGSRPMVEESNP